MMGFDKYVLQIVKAVFWPKKNHLKTAVELIVWILPGSSLLLRTIFID